MGDLILLADFRATRVPRAARRSRPLSRPAGPARPAPAATTFWFDLGSPFSYLAAERVERAGGAVRWRPALEARVLPTPSAAEQAGRRARAETRAERLHMPLVWPDAAAPEWQGAARAAAWAGEAGRAAPFVLAAGRLAFCGGFDLDDPEVLAEAADAAGLSPATCQEAAQDPARDAVIATASDCLVAARVSALPVLQVGRRLFCGEADIGAGLALVAPGRRSAVPHAG